MNRNLHHIITTIITVFISVTLYAAHTNAERLSLLQPLIQYDLAFNTGVTTDSIILWEKLLTPELEKQQRYDILFQLKAMAVQSSITEGNISLAIDNANSMYKKAKEIDYPLGTALALRAIGNTYLSSSTPQVAIGSYEEAIEIMQQIPEADIYLKNALSQMILIKLNNRQMAGIEKDINYLEALCDKRPDSPCYFYLPCCRAFYEIQSDKLPSALEHLQKMERIYAKHPYPYFLLLIKYLYASYHIAAKEYTQALQSYDELLPYVKESGSYKDIQISQERAKVLSLMGRIEEACEEYEVINARKDSLDANSYLRQINELHTLYQIDKNELNNINRQKKILYWSWFIILSVLSLIIFFIFRIKRNNKRLIQSQQEQEKVKKQAENSIRTKSLFLSNMSHEIRTPLNAIVGFSEIMVLTENEEEKHEYLEIIQKNSNLLLQLINDILDLSRIESGKSEMHFQQVEIAGLVDEVEKVHQLKMKLNVDLKVVRPQGEFWTSTDRNRVMQVLFNFLSNAIKNTETGSITLGLKQEGDWLKLFVSDTGCGIPEEKLPQIFTRFEKLNDFVQGTGLGLSICKSIVERLGGRIEVSSELGQGSTFALYLPYQEIPVEVAERSLSTKIDSESVRHKKILVVEDIESNFAQLNILLKKEYTILWVRNGQEAINSFIREKPDLILMDIRMPVMDGIQAMEKICTMSFAVPIIAVMAYAFYTEQQAIQAGCNAVISKPYSVEKLRETIESYIG